MCVLGNGGIKGRIVEWHHIEHPDQKIALFKLNFVEDRNYVSDFNIIKLEIKNKLQNFLHFKIKKHTSK